ncbi:hypothetical protein D1007_27084 [Hordeum vulgare]|nr:hypothetical protein D1007_27084 [Hordeum vulgare]
MRAVLHTLIREAFPFTVIANVSDYACMQPKGNGSFASGSINTLEQLLAEDDKYKVFSFDLDITGGRAGHDQMVLITEFCMHDEVLAWHLCMATRPCEHFARFVNNPDYMFASVDTTNDLKVLKPSGLSFEKLADIQGQYMVWGSEKKKQKDSLVDLAAGIINPYYRV